MVVGLIVPLEHVPVFDATGLLLDTRGSFFLKRRMHLGVWGGGFCVIPFLFFSSRFPRAVPVQLPASVFS